MSKFNSLVKISVSIVLVYLLSILILPPILFASEETITVPAENSHGVTLDLKKGDYVVKIGGGAVTLSYPINPNYHWLIGVAVGTDVEGGQDEPNIGTLYFEPAPLAHTQAETEEQALKAVKENRPGTFLKFTLTEDKMVRFWVSDFDYTDNNGMIKLVVLKEGKL